MTLKEFFQENPKVALAFSGGVDSAYLLYEALNHGAEVKAYFVKSQFQPAFEMEDAQRLAGELTERFGLETGDADMWTEKVRAEEAWAEEAWAEEAWAGAKAPETALPLMQVLVLDVLADQNVTANPKDRCYYCKQRIFGKLLETAAADGFHVMIDGTNASDEEDDRPGMRALKELQVKSPLRLCGLTKDEIRRRSKDAQLFTWDKPSYACLATRITTGVQINEEDLNRVEQAETLLEAMGFRDFRVRLVYVRGSSIPFAKIQLLAGQMADGVARRSEIVRTLKPLFADVLLDMEGR